MGKVKTDLVFAGLPCPPFSRIRHKRGTHPEIHPDYEVVMEEFISCCMAHSVRSFAVEETEGFLEKGEDGVRFIDIFSGAAGEAGYHCRALKCRSEDWIQWPRQRLCEKPKWVIAFQQYANIVC